MATARIVIKDEINVKIEGLDLDTRKELVKKFKYFDQSARYKPAYKLGRWDGCTAFFGLGGTTYVSLLDRVLPLLEQWGYYIEIEDLRNPISLNFDKVAEDFWGDLTWPEGHRFAGHLIRLREDQVEVVNKFLENPQCIQEIATGFGKTITTATLSKICEKFGRTITIVPNKDLVVQTEEDFLNCQLDVGVYFGDRKELGKTHTICTWQSLNILDKRSKNTTDDELLTLAELLENVQCVMVDECFDGNSKVLTADGTYIPIKNIKSGDKIINYSENTQEFKVDTVVNQHINLTKSSNEKMYELTFDNGNTINVTGNHLFLTTTGWIRADELTEEHEIVNKYI
jgi:hypothetical protein